jgi:multidrug efflux pump subunit AcrA (membrane-fusion protein)
MGIAIAMILMRPESPPVPKVEPVPLVELAAVRPHTGTVDLEADGVVVPHREIQLAAQVEGRVIFKADVCRAGFYVPPKTLLLRIDPTDYQLQRETLEQELRQATNALEQLKVELANIEELLRVAEADYQLEKRSFARQEELHRGRIISDADYEQAQRSLLKAENALVSLQNQLRAARARWEGLEATLQRVKTQLAEVQVRLSRTEIYSPEDVETVVIRDPVEVGDYVRNGTLVAVLEDVSQVEVRVSLRRDQLSWIWAAASQQASQSSSADPSQAYRLPPLPVTVIHELDGAEFAWEGVLWRYEGLGLNEATRTIPCRILVPQVRQSRRLNRPQGWRVPAGPPMLMRGMFVSLRIHLPPTMPMVCLPEEALQPGNWVWRFQPESAEESASAGTQQVGTSRAVQTGEPTTSPDTPGDQEALRSTVSDSGRKYTSSAVPANSPSGESPKRGRIYRVEVEPVASQRVVRLVYAKGGAETVIDGKVLRFENGQLVRYAAAGAAPEVLFPGPVEVVLEEGTVPIDGTRLQVIDGVLYEVTGQERSAIPEPRLKLPPSAPIGVRLFREIITPVRVGYLDPDALVVVTPVVAEDGTLVQIRGTP